MELNDAQQRVWQEQGGTSVTLKEGIGRLSKLVEVCQDAFETDQWVQAQTALEDSLIQMLLVTRLMGLDLDRALLRALVRQRETIGQRVFVVFADRVEIQVAGECRGGWPLYTEEDYKATLQVARELRCEVMHSDIRQLDLFGSGRSPKSHEAPEGNIEAENLFQTRIPLPVVMVGASL